MGNISLKVSYMGQCLYYDGFDTTYYRMGSINFRDLAYKNLVTPLMDYYYSLAKGQIDPMVNNSVTTTLERNAEISELFHKYVKDRFIAENRPPFIPSKTEYVAAIKKLLNDDFREYNILTIEMLEDGKPLHDGKHFGGNRVKFERPMPFDLASYEISSGELFNICDDFLSLIEKFAKGDTTEYELALSNISSNHLTQGHIFDKLTGDIEVRAFDRRYNTLMSIGEGMRSKLVWKYLKFGEIEVRDVNRIYSEVKRLKKREADEVSNLN